MHNSTLETTAGRSGAYLCLSLAMVIVGSSGVMGKWIVQSYPVFLASGLRFAVATLLMLPLLVRRRRELAGIGRSNWLLLAAMAFCGQFLFTVLLLWGLKWTNALDAGLITSTTPAAMGLVAVVMLGERPRIAQVAAMVMAVAGVMAASGLLSFDGPLEEKPLRLAGNLLICAAVAGEAVFLLLRKRLPPALSPMALTALLCALGLVMFLPPALVQARAFAFARLTPADIGSLAYFGAIYTVLAYFLWFKGVTRVSGHTAGIFTALMPVSATVLAVACLQERITLGHIGGLALVVGAVLPSLRPGANQQSAGQRG